MPDNSIMYHRIKDIFLQLCEANDYEKVSVTVLCKAAGINRSTFYFYFESIEALLDEIEYDFLQHIPFKDFSAYEPVLYGQVLKYTNYVSNNRSVFFILIRNGRLVTAFIRKSRRKSQIFSERKRPFLFKIDTSNLLSAYTTVGSIALLETWLKEHPEYPAERIAQIICRMALEANRMLMQ